jgi:hypothetical protein
MLTFWTVRMKEAVWLYQAVLESSRTAIVVIISMKDERGGQGHTSVSLLHQSAM